MQYTGHRPVMLSVVLCWLCVLLCARGRHASDKTLVVVPGMSARPNRTNTVLLNMELLFKYDSDFHCLIHVYSHMIPSAVLDKLDVYGCTLQYFHESNHYADYLKTLLPSLLRYGNFNYVMILLDDVELQPTFRLRGILDIMQRNNLSVISPGIHGSTMSSTTPYKHSARAKQFRMPPIYTLGSIVQSIEIFATIFTVDSWACMWDLVEPRWNSAGWGYDLCFYNYCRTKIPALSMGVVYSMTARHHNEFGKIQRSEYPLADMGHFNIANKHPGHQYDYWVKQMKLQRNITLVPVLKHSRGAKLH